MIRIVQDEFDDDHNHQVQCHELCTMCNRDCTTSRAEESVWYHQVYDDKPEQPAANATGTEQAAFKDWMNRHGVARLTIRLGTVPRIQAEYMVVNDAKTLWEKLASAYKSKQKLNIFNIREDLWSIKLQDCGDVDNYVSRIDQSVKYYNLCAGP
jgi:hypothetical protein